MFGNGYIEMPKLDRKAGNGYEIEFIIRPEHDNG